MVRLLTFAATILISSLAHAQMRDYDRGGAIREIEQALFLLGLKNDAPDTIWDAASQSGLTTLRQRIQAAGIQELYRDVIRYDPTQGIDSEVVLLSIKIWQLFQAYAPGRAGMALVSDGPTKIFVGLRAQSMVAQDTSKSPWDWCIDYPGHPTRKYVQIGIELPFDSTGQIDLRRDRNTQINRVFNGVVVPYLQAHCPQALTLRDGYYRDLQVKVFISGEFLGEGLLRKQCPFQMSDSSIIVSVQDDPNTPGKLLGAAFPQLSAVGLDGVPEHVITRELLQEEEMFAPRIDCSNRVSPFGAQHMSQFKNRYGY